MKNNPYYIDLTDLVSERLTVIRRAENGSQGQPRWLCRCTCGTEVERKGQDIRKGTAKSCGCLQREAIAVRAARKCSFEGCDKPLHAEGFCSVHRHRHRRGADMAAPVRHQERRIPGATCSANACERPAINAGFCGMHYMRKRTGKPLDATHRQLKGQGKHLRPDGYVLVTVPPGTPGTPGARKNAMMFEHRYVMQNWLGRPLMKAEQVHHRNGIRKDNRIKNLELMTGAHGNKIKATDSVLHCLDRIEHLVALDPYQKIVLDEIKQRATGGNIFHLKLVKKAQAYD